MFRIWILVPLLVYLLLRPPQLLTGRFRRFRGLMRAFILVAFILGVGTFIYFRRYDPPLDPGLSESAAWAALALLGYLATVLLILVPLDLLYLGYRGARSIWRLLKKPRLEAPADPTRRSFLRESA